MIRKLVLMVLVLCSGTALAIDLDTAGHFQVTGFYDLTAGKVIGGGYQGMGSYDYYPVFGTSPTLQPQWRCPCTIQNWEYADVYQFDKGWQADVESLIGAQFTARYDKHFSATAQLVSRSSNGTRADYVPTLDWAYATWKPTEDLTIQAGQKRIPLYYYSDYLYIGYSYPWVRPAPDVYGWPIYAYQGANVQYQKYLGDSDWVVTTNVWYGNKTNRDDAYDTLIYYGTPTNHTWSNMIGDWTTLSNGTFELRAMMMGYKESMWQDNADGSHAQINHKQFTRIKGVDFNVDWKGIIWKSELNQYTQNVNAPNRFVYDYYLAGLGYHFWELTPMVTLSHYVVESYYYAGARAPTEARSTRYFSLRWDFMKNVALKVQYDLSRDHSEYMQYYGLPFLGDSKLFSISLQGVF